MTPRRCCCACAPAACSAAPLLAFSKPSLSATPADVNGTAPPPSAGVQQLEAELCSQPLPFGSQLAALVGGQDQQAQDWVEALLSAECAAAAAQALQRAFDVHRTSPGGLQAVIKCAGQGAGGIAQLSQPGLCPLRRQPACGC